MGTRTWQDPKLAGAITKYGVCAPQRGRKEPSHLLTRAGCSCLQREDEEGGWEDALLQGVKLAFDSQGPPLG